MTIIEKTNTIEARQALTNQINDLLDERAKISNDLRAEGVAADEIIKADLSEAAQQAQQALADLDRQIQQAEARKTALDAAVDRGDDSVDDMELFKAGTAVRRLKGKRPTADMALRKAQRAVDPFEADNHLALLVTDTLETLVDVPIVVRKRPTDVQGITDAIVLSQVEPVEGYGSHSPSGRVKFSEIGNTGLDLEALETALQSTGSEVQVHPGLIDYEVALWDLPRLIEPSARAVGHFAEVLARTFQAIVEGPTANRGYATYATLWETTTASLEITEPGKAKGKLVASVGIERERPPLSQMHEFINQTLAHFDTGVHTAAGLLESITLVEVLDAGPWLRPDEAYIHGRGYPQRFIVNIDLTYVFDQIEAV